MKSGTIVVLIVLVLIIAGAIYYFGGAPAVNPSENQNPAPTGVTYNIKIIGYAFGPAILNIKAGDTVVWTNNDKVSHTVTSDSGTELNSATLAKGDTYSHTFATAGTYKYHCSAYKYMIGKLIVS